MNKLFTESRQNRYGFVYFIFVDRLTIILSNDAADRQP